MKFISHYKKNKPKAISLTTELASFWYSGPGHASVSATKIGTQVLQIHQDEVRDGQRRHCQLISPYLTNSSGRAGLANNSCHPKVTPSKRPGNRHPFEWRGFGISGTHCLRCILLHVRPSNRGWTYSLDTRAGTVKHRRNCGANQ
jgi:hypothetical protein